MLNILITGANGQLGRSLQRLGCVSPHNYICTDVAELDITDAGAVLRAVREQGIDVIVNCAAYTDVEQRRARRLGRRREIARGLVVQQLRRRFVILGPLHVGIGRTVHDNVDPLFPDRKSTRLNSSHPTTSRMPSSA